MRKILGRCLVLAGLAWVVGCSGGNNAAANSPGVQPPGTAKGGAVADSDGVGEKDFPVPFYPGATVNGDDNKPYALVAQGNKHVQVGLITSDSTQQVEDFYKPKLPKEEDNVTPGQVAMKGTWPNGNDCSIVANKTDKGTTIDIVANSKQ